MVDLVASNPPNDFNRRSNYIQKQDTKHPFTTQVWSHQRDIISYIRMLSSDDTVNSLFLLLHDQTEFENFEPSLPYYIQINSIRFNSISPTYHCCV